MGAFTQMILLLFVCNGEDRIKQNFDEQVIIDCNTPSVLGIGDTCTIKCDTSGLGDDRKQFFCGNAETCIIECSAKLCGKESVIHANFSTNLSITSTADSCLQSSIIYLPYQGNADITALTEQTDDNELLQNAQFYSLETNSISIKCIDTIESNEGMCESMIIHASNANYLYLLNFDAEMDDGSSFGTKVYCPINSPLSPSCVINATYAQATKDMEIYAKQGTPIDVMFYGGGTGDYSNTKIFCSNGYTLQSDINGNVFDSGDCYITAPPTTAPTTNAPTTAVPTSLQPTTNDPTTVMPSSIQPTTNNPTTYNPTTNNPTTYNPTTSVPTTTPPTTNNPTTSAPTTNTLTAVPTTYNPTTYTPTTNNNPTEDGEQIESTLNSVEGFENDTDGGEDNLFLIIMIICILVVVICIGIIIWLCVIYCKGKNKKIKSVQINEGKHMHGTLELNKVISVSINSADTPQFEDNIKTKLTVNNENNGELGDDIDELDEMYDDNMSEQAIITAGASPKEQITTGNMDINENQSDGEQLYSDDKAYITEGNDNDSESQNEEQLYDKNNGKTAGNDNKNNMKTAGNDSGSESENEEQLYDKNNRKTAGK